MVSEEDESSSFVQEMMVRLKRSSESEMSICFTWFPIGGLGKPNYIIIWLNLQEGGKILEGV